jgi:magnesium-protoporphyrin O-methyltransferase
MGNCCRAGPCEEVFSSRVAAWDLRQYRRRGPGRLERHMLAAIPAGDLPGARVLEIGGGIGALQAELLLAGAQSGEVIELVGSYAPYARELAAALGIAGRSSFRVADLLADPQAAAAASADIVLLNRVICCSADGLALTALAARLTRGTLLLSYPRDTLPVRWGSRLQHALFRLLQRQFRFFVRPASAIIAAAEAEGLTLVRWEQGLLWEFVALRRRADPPGEAPPAPAKAAAGPTGMMQASNRFG